MSYLSSTILPILPLKKPHRLRLGPSCVNCSSLVQQLRPCVTSQGLLDPGVHVVSDASASFIELINPLNIVCLFIIYVYLSSFSLRPATAKPEKAFIGITSSVRTSYLECSYRSIFAP